ncbi:coiled-coil domain-containing protein [Metabacillus arenae]|uniref:Uncharacterized protein n=1 Tax=Metabacillus arenae TaxID=2771434 RepID=A0A926NFE5_9BACI|nr:hypothetical protein [Metabacillus arenae]MBD1378998.1 hypothetical protein [Metabacillus arenae]
MKIVNNEVMLCKTSDGDPCNVEELLLKSEANLTQFSEYESSIKKVNAGSDFLKDFPAGIFLLLKNIDNMKNISKEKEMRLRKELSEKEMDSQNYKEKAQELEKSLIFFMNQIHFLKSQSNKKSHIVRNNMIEGSEATLSTNEAICCDRSKDSVRNFMINVKLKDTHIIRHEIKMEYFHFFDLLETMKNYSFSFQSVISNTLQHIEKNITRYSDQNKEIQKEYSQLERKLNNIKQRRWMQMFWKTWDQDQLLELQEGMDSIHKKVDHLQEELADNKQFFNKLSESFDKLENSEGKYSKGLEDIASLTKEYEEKQLEYKNELESMSRLIEQFEQKQREDEATILNLEAELQKFSEKETKLMNQLKQKNQTMSKMQKQLVVPNHLRKDRERTKKNDSPLNQNNEVEKYLNLPVQDSSYQIMFNPFRYTNKQSKE